MSLNMQIGLVIAVLTLCSCMSSKAPTLQSLSDRDIVVEQKEIGKVSREKVMESYHEYLDNAPSNHPMYSNALNRLADLEMQAGDDKLFRENEEQYKEAFQVASKGEEEQGQENYFNAIKLYKGLLKTNPSDKRNDWVMYQLARAYEQVADLENALSVLTDLVSKFPKSEYILEAQFRRGEIYFSFLDYPNAEKAFGLVLQKGKKTNYYKRALYKYGWAQFKQDRYESALDAFFAILQVMPVVYDLQEKIDTRALTRVEKDLFDDIFRSINLCISYAGGVTYASRYFDKYKRLPFEYEVFNRLGEEYVKNDRIKDGADAFGVFVRRQPHHPMSSSLQIKRITAYDNGRFSRSALSSRKDFVLLFGVGTEFWYRQNSSTKAILRTQVKKILNELSDYYHAKLQSNKKRNEYFVQATKWYKEYVRMFPGDPEAGQKQFLLGDLYSEKKLYANAAVAYDKSAFNYDKHKYTKEASYAAVNAYNKAMSASSGLDRDQWRSKMLEASIKYITLFSKEVKTASVKAKVVEELYHYKRFDEAIKYGKEVLDNPSSKSHHKISSNIIIAHVSFDREDYLLAKSHYQAALKVGIKSARLKNAVVEKLAAATYQNAESMKKEGDLNSAAKAFLAANAVSPKTEMSIKAKYDAAASYMKLESWEEAIKVLEEFRVEYPKHKLQVGVTEKLSIAYEKSGQLSKAAKEIIKIGAASTNPSVRQEAYWNAALLFESEKNKKLAIKSYKLFVRAKPKSIAKSLEAKQKLVELYYQTGQLKKRKYWLKSIVKDYSRNKNRIDDRGRYIIASAAFNLADKNFSSFEKVKLKLPLKSSLRRKKALMKTVLKDYELVNEIGVAEFSTASTYRIAEIYQQFGHSLMSSQRPKKLNAEEREEYDLLLEEQAYPFEEKAIKIFEINISRMRDGLYDSWIQKSIGKLAQLQPVRYGKEETQNEMYTSIF